MRHVPTLLRRELAAYFLSPMAYLILLAFQAIAWLNFWQLIETLKDRQVVFSGLSDPMTVYISGSTPFWVALLVAVPALTMRLVAEERRSGTLEPLLTVPVTEAEVTVAKWLSGVVMYWVLLLPFALYLPFLRHFGHYDFDPGPLLSLALGLTTIGMMFVSIGLFFTRSSKNQIVAAVETFAVLFLLLVVTLLATSYGAASRASWTDAARFVSVLDQVQSFAWGKLDLRFLALHLSVTVLMLFGTAKALELRRGM